MGAETCRGITVIKKVHLVGDFAYIVKMHGANSIKLMLEQSSVMQEQFE
jgi:hypothetical protein